MPPKGLQFRRVMDTRLATAILLLSGLSLILMRPNPARTVYAAQSAHGWTLEMAGEERTVRPQALRLEIENKPAEPWTTSEVQQPADLDRELADPKSEKPLVVCVGFEFLFRSGHIPGAVFHGPAAKPGGLVDLKKWARSIPRGQPILIYCGCCPWDRCPNVRPAFKVLRQMGFSRLKVLLLKTDLASDWVERGFPVQRGK